MVDLPAGPEGAARVGGDDNHGDGFLDYVIFFILGVYIIATIVLDPPIRRLIQWMKETASAGDNDVKTIRWIAAFLCGLEAQDLLIRGVQPLTWRVLSLELAAMAIGLVCFWLTGLAYFLCCKARALLATTTGFIQLPNDKKSQ